MTAIAACRTCGTEHLEHARFCDGCGLPVEDSETRAEYKQVTVVFADVVHSMNIAATVGASWISSGRAGPRGDRWSPSARCCCRAFGCTIAACEAEPMDSR
jgi:hypothetical protein